MRTEYYLSDKLNTLNMNLHTLSEVSGVAYSTIYNLFTGKKSISDAKTDSLYKIARVLGISMDELYRLFAIDVKDNQQIMPDFLLMWKDEVIGDVHIGPTEVTIKRFNTHPAKQIFYKDTITRFEFGEILRHRCWDEHRPDIKRLLNLIDLDEFNPYKICLKTHGKMVQDFTWFKFEGETINYKQLLESKHA